MDKLLLQLFAEEEELETTNSNEEVEEETTEEVVETETEEPEEPAATEKTFTQAEVDEMVQSRLRREKNKLDRDYNKELSKYKEIAYLTQRGLEAETIEEALEKSREFYNKKGINYVPERSARETEILASADANDIIDACDNEELEKEIKKYLDKGESISKKDSLVAQKLIDELNSRNRISGLEKIGVSADVYNSKEFKAFEKQFTKETPIETIYSLYHKEESKPSNPGSMKTIASKTKKDYITEAEYDRMTDKEIEENMDLIRYSMTKW